MSDWSSLSSSQLRRRQEDDSDCKTSTYEWKPNNSLSECNKCGNCKPSQCGPNLCNYKDKCGKCKLDHPCQECKPRHCGCNQCSPNLHNWEDKRFPSCDPCENKCCLATECDSCFDVTRGLGRGCPGFCCSNVYKCIIHCGKTYSIGVSILSNQTTFSPNSPIPIVYRLTNTGNAILPVGTMLLFKHNHLPDALQKTLIDPLFPGASISFNDTYTPTPSESSLPILQFTLEGWATLTFTKPCPLTTSVYDPDCSGITLTRM